MGKLNPSRALIFVGLFFVLGLVVTYFATTTRDYSRPVKQFSELGGDFTLQSYQGEVSLSSYQGNVVVMYFGYTSCAEVCPESLSVMKRAMDRLEEEGIKNVQGVMISVDPSRDNVEALRKFTRHFNERIIGLTGTRQQIKAVGELYGVYYDDAKIRDIKYSVEHASRFYIIDTQGNLVTAMSHTTTPNELAAQIRELI
ncbi:MAG: electron transporter [Gammaproteobacteria bacterium]|nr:MAG: electron transporter [Gammaproteobacteria bacterium]